MIWLEFRNGFLLNFILFQLVTPIFNVIRIIKHMGRILLLNIKFKKIKKISFPN